MDDQDGGDEGVDNGGVDGDDDADDNDNTAPGSSSVGMVDDYIGVMPAGHLHSMDTSVLQGEYVSTGIPDPPAEEATSSSEYTSQGLPQPPATEAETTHRPRPQQSKSRPGPQ